MAHKTKGTTLLHVQIDESDIDRVREAFKAGKLAHLGFVGLEFPDRPELNIQTPEESHAARHDPVKRSDPPRR